MSKEKLLSELSVLEDTLEGLYQRESEINSSRYPDKKDRELAWEDLIEYQIEVESEISNIKKVLEQDVNTN